MCAGIASSRHKKGAIGAFLVSVHSYCCSLLILRRDGLGQTAAAPASAGLLHRHCRQLAAPALGDGLTGRDGAIGRFRHNPDSGGCFSSHSARPSPPAGPCYPSPTSGRSRSGCGHNQGKAHLSPCRGQHRDSASYSLSTAESVSVATRVMALSSMTILPCL